MISEQEKIDLIVNLLKQAVNKIYEDDKTLLSIKENERTIVFHIGRYLIDLMRPFKCISNYNVDCEYNRDGIKPKTSNEINPDGTLKKIFPDLIVHIRTDPDNLLVVEVKGYWNNDDRKHDIKKLEFYTNQNEKFKYKIGVLIELKLNSPQYRYFKDGEEIDNE
jgi:hypothetical protein